MFRIDEMLKNTLIVLGVCSIILSAITLLRSFTRKSNEYPDTMHGTEGQNKEDGIEKQVFESTKSHLKVTLAAFQGLWCNGTKVYLNIIHLDSITDSITDTINQDLAVGFLSFQPLSLQSFEYQVALQMQRVSVTCIEKAFILDDLVIKQLKLFHHQFFRTVLRSEFDASFDWTTMCVPLKINYKDDINRESINRDYFDPKSINLEKINSDNTNRDNIDPKSIIDFEALEFCETANKHNLAFLYNHSLSPSQIAQYVLFDETRYKRYFTNPKIMHELNPYSAYKESLESEYINVSEVYAKDLLFPGYISPHQCLIQAKTIGHPINSKFPPKKYKKVMLIPQFLSLCPIKLKHLKEAIKYPLLLRAINHRLLMQDILDAKYFTHSDTRLQADINLLQMAFTASSAAEVYNYERLEFIGDAFLKLHLSLQLFIKEPMKQEGCLTKSRTQLENNKYLWMKVYATNQATHINVEGFILSDPMSRKQFIPPSSMQTQVISDGCVADVVEAVIGACYLSGGVQAASDCVCFFLGSGCALDWDACSVSPDQSFLQTSVASIHDPTPPLNSSGIPSLQPSSARLHDPTPPLNSSGLSLIQPSSAIIPDPTSPLNLRGIPSLQPSSARLPDPTPPFNSSGLPSLQPSSARIPDSLPPLNLSGIPSLQPSSRSTFADFQLLQSKIGYKFKDPRILAQALTHPTASGSKSQSYERLEFLGDALLGFIIAEFVYNLRPELTPGTMSELRSELVNNQFLGFLCCSLGFDGFIEYENDELGGKIVSWSDLCSQHHLAKNIPLSEKQNEVLASGLFWSQLHAAPKVLGDVYESILGAIFLDSGFKLQPVKDFIDKTMFIPWWPSFIPLLNPKGLGVVHPVTALTQLVQSMHCLKLTVEMKFIDKIHHCCFRLHSLDIGVYSAVNKKDAKKGAADLALIYISRNKEEIFEKCDCKK